MSDVQQLSAIQRLPVPLVILLHVVCVVVGPAVLMVVAVVVGMALHLEDKSAITLLMFSFMLVGAILPSILISRARRRRSPPGFGSPPPLPQYPALTSSQPDLAVPETSTTKAKQRPPVIAPMDPDEDQPDADEDGPMRGSARMVDWVQSFKLPLTFLIALPSIALMAGEVFKDSTKPWWQAAPYVIAGLAVLLVPLSLVSQLIGFSFDGDTDRLSYPYYFFRRRLRLSEIDDANCQTTSKRVIDHWNSLAEKNPKYKSSKRYIVNLSGDFGARRVIFRSKYKRDQFLSLIRTFAPQVRITRWS